MCGGFSVCRYMNTQPKIILPNGKRHRPKHDASCKTLGVIHLLMCLGFYVGKTKFQFYKRAARHITSIKNANPFLPLGRHVRDKHAGIPPRFLFTVLHPGSRLEKNPASKRGLLDCRPQCNIMTRFKYPIKFPSIFWMVLVQAVVKKASFKATNGAIGSTDASVVASYC